MRTRNSNRRKAEFFRKIGVVVLLAYFALGAGISTASVLCLGGDGHTAIEFAASCVFCGVRSNLPGQQESMTPVGKHSSGDSCGPCRDYSFSFVNVVSGVFVPSPSGLDDGHVALPLIACVEGPWSMIPLASSVSGPPEPPDPTAIHTRPVVLLI